MNEKKFNLFCPKCNMLVETKVIAKGSGKIKSTNPLNMVDTPYNIDLFFISLCPRCDQPFLIKRSLYGVPGEFETIVDEVILYPNQLKFPVENLPPTVQTAYEQAKKAFNAGLYEACVLMCRKTIEATCKSLNASGKNLYHRLEKLKNLGYLDQRLLNWSHEIRDIGNDAAHDVNTEITIDDAKDILDLTEAILLYIFSLNNRFIEYKRRKDRQRT